MSGVEFATRAIHLGYDAGEHLGALNAPLFLSSTFVFPDAERGASRFAGEKGGYIYGRIGNPTAALLEARMAALEGAEAALATASGMGAITSAIWTLISPGDEIITDRTLYGCTFSFFRHALSNFGIDVRHVDLSEPALLEAAVSDRTKLVYFETPANPNMRLIDIAAIASICAPRGIKVVVDNTFCTPYLQRPIELGADLVVHSATKYLGGHGDLLAGIVAGREDVIGDIRMRGLKDMTGAVISPFDAFLVLRGLKTLELRMDRHCASAATIAQRLAEHPKVARLHYPGSDSHPQKELAMRQMPLGAGGVISFELADPAAVFPTIDRLKLVQCAVSLGDAESLIQHPWSMTHSPYSQDERQAYGISETLLRLSVGLEGVEDIWADLAAALHP